MGSPERDAESFASWLRGSLRAWSADEAVWGDYIEGLLQAGEEHALPEVLADLLPEAEQQHVVTHAAAIVARWAADQARPPPGPAPDLRLPLALALPAPQPAPAPRAPPPCSADERRLRDSILQQYGRLQLEPADEAPPDDELGRNMNAATVAAAARERREQAKQESQRKRDKDKEDREKQKQLKEEKKEKRKTVKGERKR